MRVKYESIRCRYSLIFQSVFTLMAIIGHILSLGITRTRNSYHGAINKSHAMFKCVAFGVYGVGISHCMFVQERLRYGVSEKSFSE